MHRPHLRPRRSAHSPPACAFPKSDEYDPGLSSHSASPPPYTWRPSRKLKPGELKVLLMK